MPDMVLILHSCPAPPVKLDLNGVFELLEKAIMADERSSSVMNALDSLLVNPFVTMTGLAKKENISYPAAKRVVDKLIGYGILSAIGSRAKNKVYASQTILKILSE